MGTIKKVQDLTVGDGVVFGGGHGNELYRVTEVCVGERKVGVTAQYAAVATNRLSYVLLDIDTDVYVPIPADASTDLVDRSMTAPPPR